MEKAVRAGYRSEGLTPGIVESFHRFLALFYRQKGRDLPWRRTTDPYHILVSEFMLQQTQVERVLVKYPEFLGRFPDVEALARAPVQEVLLAWQGLGYNRRALALHRTARRIAEEFHGEVPLDRATLDSFPGIGSATAGAIVVFSTNRPEIFIETNIRRVYIHLFFPGAEKVHDREIGPLLEKTLDRERPRRFYHTLMDYGSLLKRGTGDPNGPLLKKGTGNPNLRSASYARQTPFEGSDRQVRGIVLRELLGRGEIADEGLGERLSVEPGRLERILRGLERDGFIVRGGGRIRCRENMERSG
ncbi:MAG TPA: A/G-specific adenine glycosylase [Methanomicrobiales archaeon]|jgi:A/G-specific adenine glycosylase|nr:A/G-specific adenine glycosylase [Methanomicrobiales archaeon]